MRSILGIIIVIASILLGYTMHFGDLRLLWQPHEMVIILGTAFGTIILSNQSYLIIGTFKSLPKIFKSVPHTREDYLELLLVLFNLIRLKKSKGLGELEKQLNNYEKSDFFKNSTHLINSDREKKFLLDGLRMITMGLENPEHFEGLLDKEIDTIEEDLMNRSKIMLNLGELLPALGIVAAVLGVIIAMSNVSSSPEILGSMIASALVGTFSGVLFAYGLFYPLGQSLTKYHVLEIDYFECIKNALVCLLRGEPAVIAVEFARKSITDHLRPDFEQLEQFTRRKAIKIVEQL